MKAWTPTLAVALLICPQPAAADTYAIMFQGGWFPWADAGFFAAQVDLYNCMLASGIPAGRIWAYEGDGVIDPANPNCNVMSRVWYGGHYSEELFPMLYDSPVDYDGDGLADVRGAGTAANLFGALSQVGELMGPDDGLILQIGDHGGADPARFGAWLHESIYWSDVAAALDAIPAYAHQLVIVGTCHGAASFEHLATPGSRRVIISASTADYYSWYRMPTYYWCGPRHLELAAEGGSGFLTALCAGAASGDRNADGLVDAAELYQYIWAHDEFGPNGSFDWTLYPGFYCERPQFADPDGIAGELIWAHGRLVGGDANLDGLVDIADLAALATHYGQTAATWAMGDFSGDGDVDVGDLGILTRNYGRRPAPPAGVPETEMLLPLVLLPIICARRRGPSWI